MVISTSTADRSPSFGRRIRILVHGGLGDALLATPLFAALRKKFPNSKIIAYCYKEHSHKEIFINNPNVDSVRILNRFWSLHLKLVKHYNTSYGHLFPSITCKVNAAFVIANKLGIELDDSKLHIFLTEKEDQEACRLLERYRNPIVIQITSQWCKNQMWDLDRWNALVRSMPDFTFLQLGVEGEEAVAGAVNLCGQTSFRQAAAILKNCLCFVGVVSSLAHASNAVGVPGVVFYGPSSQSVWGHDNLICLDKKLRCAPCVDMLHGECPYDRECMTRISVAEVKIAIWKQVGGRLSPSESLRLMGKKNFSANCNHEDRS